MGRCRWSPDSASLILTDSRGGERRLRTVSVPDMETVWEFAHKDIRGCGFARDGGHVWCVTRDELLWIAYPGGNVEHRICIGGPGGGSKDIPVYDVNDPCIQPTADGPSLLFLRPRSHVWRWQVGAPGTAIARESDRSVRAEEPEPRREKAPFELEDGREISIAHGDPARPKRLAAFTTGVSPSIRARLGEAGYETLTAEDRDADGAWRERYEKAIQSACARKAPSLAGGRPVAAISMYTMAADLLSILCESTAQLHAAVLVAPDLRTHELADVEALADLVRIPLFIVHPTRTATSTDKIEALTAKVRSNGHRCDVMFVDDTDPLHAHREVALDGIVAFLDDVAPHGTP